MRRGFELSWCAVLVRRQVAFKIDDFSHWPAASLSLHVGGGFHRNAGRSPIWSHDASRWNASELVGRLIVGSECGAVRARRAAHDMPFPVASAARGGLPRLIVCHRTFDRKETPVEVGDDQEDRYDRASVRHGVSYPIFRHMIPTGEGAPARAPTALEPSGGRTELSVHLPHQSRQFVDLGQHLLRLLGIKIKD